MAVYSYQWTELVVKRYQQLKKDSDIGSIAPYIQDYVLPVVFTCVSS